MNYPSYFYVFQTGPLNIYGEGLYDGKEDSSQTRLQYDDFVTDIIDARIFDVRVQPPGHYDTDYWLPVFVTEEFATTREVSKTPYLDFYLLNKKSTSMVRNNV